MFEEDDEIIQETSRRFSQQKLAPHGRDWERHGTIPPGLLLEMGNLGLFGILIPDQYGGLGRGSLTWAIAMEEIAAGNGGISTIMHVHALGTCAPIARLGTEDQKQQWLPAMIRGEAIGCIGLSEPHAGSDLAKIKTRARRVPGGWSLTGVKQFITNGAIADIAIILAVTDPSAGSHGTSFFLVPTDTPGYVVGKIEEKLGQKISDTAQIILDECILPESALLGQEGEALSTALGMLSDGRISVGAQAVGIARAAFEAAVTYAKEREAFGSPIAQHQAIAFRLADMATQIEVARAFVHHAARLIDTGQDSVKEASMAKLFAGEMAERVCSDAIQIHGGYGYLADFPVERLYRDVRVCQIYEGTNDIQRLIIARKVLT